MSTLTGSDIITYINTYIGSSALKPVSYMYVTRKAMYVVPYHNASWFMYIVNSYI